MKETQNFLGNKNLVLYEMEEHSEEWHTFRTQGFGGSDAATVLGANKYRSKLQIFLEKVGYYKRKTENTPPLVFGHALEDVVLDMWRYLDGEKDNYLNRYVNKNPLRTYEEVKGYVVNKNFPWLYHSVDGLIPPGQVCIYTGEVLDQYRVLEAKTIDPNHARQWTKGYPEYYRFQVQQYMLGFELPSAEMVVMSLDRRLYGDLIYEDHQDQKDILEESHDLWCKIVEGRQIMDAELNEDELIQELGNIQPEISGDNPYSLNDFLSRNAQMKEDMAMVAPDHIRRAAESLQRLGKIKTLVDSKKVMHEVVIRDMMSKERVYKVDFEDQLGGQCGYLNLSTRKHSDKLIINNRVKSDHSSALEVIENILAEIIA